MVCLPFSTILAVTALFFTALLAASTLSARLFFPDIATDSARTFSPTNSQILSHVTLLSGYCPMTNRYHKPCTMSYRSYISGNHSTTAYVLTQLWSTLVILRCWLAPHLLQVSVAVKTLYGKEEVQAQFIREADSMRTLNHPHIIRLYGIVLSSPLMLVSN